MVSTGFGMGRARTVLGAGHVLRANQLWAPYPDNDPDGARASMRRFYRLVADDQGLSIDPGRAAALEVEWWRLHREHQHDPGIAEDALVAALANPLLAQERLALVASHSALLDAAARS